MTKSIDNLEICQSRNNEGETVYDGVRYSPALKRPGKKEAIGGSNTIVLDIPLSAYDTKHYDADAKEQAKSDASIILQGFREKWGEDNVAFLDNQLNLSSSMLERVKNEYVPELTTRKNAAGEEEQALHFRLEIKGERLSADAVNEAITYCQQNYETLGEKIQNSAENPEKKKGGYSR